MQFEENYGASTASFLSVGGSLQTYKNTALVRFLSNTFVGSDIQAYENIAGTRISDNRTDGNLQVYKSAGGISITDNIIAENFQCKDNQSPLIESGNEVGGERECSSF